MDILKKEIRTETAFKGCTTFEALPSSLVWRARTMPLSEDSMGNGFMVTCALTTSWDLYTNLIRHAVKLVQNAIGLVNDCNTRPVIDYLSRSNARQRGQIRVKG